MNRSMKTTSSKCSSRRHPLHEAAIGGRLGFDGVLDQAGEVVANGFDLTAVEAEPGLVKVALQLLGMTAPGRVPRSLC